MVPRCLEQTLHNQVDAIEEFVEKDVTDFVLDEIEQINAMEEVMTTDEPDFTLNETTNTEIPGSGNFENIMSDGCDVSCGSSSSASNVLPGSITSTCNSNVLSSTEANAIYIVLGEIYVHCYKDMTVEKQY